MTTLRPLRSPVRPRAGSAASFLFLGGLMVSGPVGLVAGALAAPPAIARTVADRNDQPTPATLPGAARSAADRPNGQVAPPRAISATTPVVASGPTSGARTDPLDHLPARDRAGTGGIRPD